MKTEERGRRPSQGKRGCKLSQGEGSEAEGRARVRSFQNSFFMSDDYPRCEAIVTAYSLTV